MRVLVACEFSGIVRDAFAARGHDAWSCDFLPSERPGQHIQGNVLDCMNRYWDLIIAHPPCKFLCNSGVKHLYRDGQKANGIDPERWANMRKATEFFKRMLHGPALRVCVENPIPHVHAMSYLASLVNSTPEAERYDQIIQPWMFGHGETKSTCLWLSNLPMLIPTEIVEGRRPRVHYESPGPDRWKNRSRTLPGIADAMASQWGGL